MSSAWLRRLIHAGTASLLLLWFLDNGRTLRLALAAAVPLAIVLETLRLRSSKVRAGLARLAPVFRPRENERPSGAFWLVLGFAAAAWFPASAAAAGILVGAISDPAAAAVGSKWGGPARKTWWGSGAALVTAAAIGVAFGFGPVVGVGAGIVAAALERWSHPVNDNLILAPGVAAFLWLTGGS